jgi:hypothetical protein
MFSDPFSHQFAGSTNLLTILLTTGSTISKIGNAITHDTAQARIQRSINSVSTPLFLNVAIPDTMQDINSETSKAVNNGA